MSPILMFCLKFPDSQHPLRGIVTAGTTDVPEVSVDAHRLDQRRKQIDWGKNTLGYQAYVQAVPKDRRQFGLRSDTSGVGLKPHPVTPDVTENCSKRCFDGQVMISRKQKFAVIRV